jgi:hypothetical protein
MAVTPSKVKLESIALQDFRLERVPSFSPENSVVNFEGSLDSKVERIGNLKCATVCQLSVNLNRMDTPFKITASCRIVASIESLDHNEILVEFANVGAVFNAIVFFRELIREVTSRTYYGPVIFPLLDITSFKPNPKE